MQKSFKQIVEQILETDACYDREAYLFLKEALEFTIKQKKPGQPDANTHVSAQELMEGFKTLGLKEFGPMAITVFEYWRVTSSEDVGKMVFKLIEAGVFGKTESDAPEDFKGALDFQSAFVLPFANKASSTEHR